MNTNITKAMFTERANQIFNQAVEEYHKFDNVEQQIANPYEEDSIEALLYLKNWVDTVQWHLEDIIRDPNIDPAQALIIKRRIDASNQVRTDLVEHIDDFFMEMFSDVDVLSDARLNTETPAWALDRLSILNIKIYHMLQETQRKDVSGEHRETCERKLNVLKMQHSDLVRAIEELLEDIAAGRKFMRSYKQMKMYNDPALNPVLYAK